MLLVAAFSAFPHAAHADDTSRVDADAGADGPARARALYEAAVEHVRNARWYDALDAFERSHALRAHPTTTFNIASCERALGRLTRAKLALERALAEGESGPDTLPSALVAEAQKSRAQLDSLLVRVSVTVAPRAAVLSVDGRPLLRLPDTSAGPLFAADVLPAGPATSLGLDRFELLIDPGAHVVSVAVKGFADAVVRREFSPGAHAVLPLELARLPATLRVGASAPGAVVFLDEVDVGAAPVVLARPAGSYRLRILRKGYETYESRVALAPGEESSIHAVLNVERVPLTARWWFWTGIVGVVAGGTALSYALLRPDAQPPPYDGGTSGVVLYPPKP